MTDNVLYGIDFRAKRARDEAELHALSQALDECFVDLGIPISKHEMSIEERVRRSIYHGAGLPYPKDSA